MRYKIKDLDKYNSRTQDVDAKISRIGSKYVKYAKSKK